MQRLSDNGGAPPSWRSRLKKLAVLGLVCLAMLNAGDAQTLPPRTATEAEIRGMLVQRIDIQHNGNAIVVGVISKHGRRIISYGRFDRDDPRIPNGETVFEIGSISKVFTSLLLCDMVLHGEVALSDPVSKYLPASVSVPTRNGKPITLLELAVHHSGLPRMPSNFNPKDPLNPYADYTVQQMYDFLSHYTLTRDPGSKYEYSNLGAGLLGHVLALRAGTDYETLLRTRVTGPLGMNHTAVQFTPEMKVNLALGHNEQLQETSNWDIPTLAGAGGIRSTADDMLIFLAANMGLRKSPLQTAIKEMLSIRKIASPGVDIALGWHIFTGSDEIVWHNGGTGGYHSFIGFSPHRKVGVVVLSNSASSIDDIGQHVLNYPVAGPLQHYQLPVPFP
jgi:CubicO group peptidase (beta-lactamase class C family)